MLVSIKSKLFKPILSVRERGFTIPELVMSITVLGIILIGLLGVFTNYLVITTRTNTSLDLAVESQGLLRSVAEEIRYGAGVRQSNTISDPNTPSGGWNTSNASFVIITAVPALNANNEYIINPDTGSPYMNEYVYFKNGSTLYKRTLAHPNASGNTKKTTCPASAVTASCPEDTKIADNVSSMVFVLYDQDDKLISDPALARSVKIDLVLTKDTLGAPVSMSNSIRATLRNTF